MLDTIWFDEVESTNRTAREMIESGQVDSNCVIAARRQTAGRGRKARSWISKDSDNLTFSLVLFFDEVPEHLSTLTLTAGVAIADALENYVNQCQLKWPNDVYVSNKKICGILSENVMFEKGCAVIVGIGINVNMTAAQAYQIDQPATSLLIETDEIFSIEDVLSQVLISCRKILDIWTEKGFAPLAEDWNKRNLHKDKQIRIHQIDGTITAGQFIRLGSQGQLILKTDTDLEVEIWEGDLVSARI